MMAAAVLLAVGSTAGAADEVYKQACAKCHGETGAADTAAGKALKTPSLVGDANVQKMSAEEVAAKIKENPKHPPTVKSLSDADISAAAATAKQFAGAK
jgi:mono/diheme cytochrome c family protein